ncbi:hypothetical protein MBLNU459_g6517t2 [Dothideomycetes sp. NU459]
MSGDKDEDDDNSKAISCRYTIRHLRPLGKVRGRKGRQHREASEKLSIDSLGKSSEVIVLRDILAKQNEAVEKGENDAASGDVQTEDTISSALTAQEIQSHTGESLRTTPQDDVNASIEKSKPSEGDNVITRSGFESKVKVLLDAFNIGQLRRYVKLHPGQRTGGSPSPEPQISAQRTAVSIHKVTHTPWHPGVSSLAKRLPKIKSATQFLKRMPQKRSVVERILRDCWNLRVEEEEDAAGEIEVLLQPDQFGLLLTKNSPALAPLLQSTKFYRNSRFELYKPDSVIRIIGPRSEAQSIAATLLDAFKDARSVTIPLDGFPKPWLKNVDFSTIFSPDQLKTIMDVTGTYVEYDARSAKSVTQSTERHMIPFLDKKALPSRFHSKQLGRPVVPFRRKMDAENPTVDVSAVALPGVAQRAMQLLSKPKAVHKTSVTNKTYWNFEAINSPWKATFGYHLEALHNVHPDSTPVRDGLTTIDNTRPNETFSPRMPGVFTILSQTDGTPTLNSNRLHSFLSPWRPATVLEAILVPSPLEEFGLLATTSFPTVKFKFSLSKPKKLSDDISPRQENKLDVKFKGIWAHLDHDICQIMLPDKPVDLRLERWQVMRATSENKHDTEIKSFANAVMSSVDNDFKLRAPDSLTVKIPIWAIKTNVPAEARSREGSDARQILRSRITAKSYLKVKYLFQGFQHRTSRIYEASNGHVGGHYFSPDHVMRIDNVEGGVTGGRRVEVSIMSKIDRNAKSGGLDTDIEANHTSPAGVPIPAIHQSFQSSTLPQTATLQAQNLLRTCFSMVDMLSDIESRGDLTPNVLPDLSDDTALLLEQGPPRTAGSMLG